MNNESEPVLVGEVDDIEVGTVEDFEHEDINFAIYRLDTGFFCTQGNCNCEERAPLSEAEIDGEELECVSCGETYSIVSGDCISQPELDGLKIYYISEEENKDKCRRCFRDIAQRERSDRCRLLHTAFRLRPDCRHYRTNCR